MTTVIESTHLPHVSVLDHLRPPDGWQTDYAVLSAYSAQTSVLAAVLLALGGADDATGSGTKVALAKVLKELRGKVHFLLQAGRLTVPRRPAQVVALLDRFILQVPWDEGTHAGRSWHAKFALVRQVPKEGVEHGERWVFMVGSRNLTMDMSWDIGLVIKAGGQAKGVPKAALQLVPGVANVRW